MAWRSFPPLCSAAAILLASTIPCAAQTRLEWDKNPETNIAGYRVYYRTTLPTFQLLRDIPEQQVVLIGGQVSFPLPSLPDGTYSFVVTAYNTSGLESGFSNEVSTVIGSATGPSDTAAPIISAVAISNTSTGASITWITNENADSQVEYGLTVNYGTSTALNPSMVTAHLQALSNLAAGTTYHYRVKSRDAAGNLAISGDFTFTTSSSGTSSPPPPSQADKTPPVISSISVTNITTSSATLSWKTNEAADAQVDYGLTGFYGSSTVLSASMVTSHVQVLNGLTSSTTYHVRVKSTDAAGNLSASEDFTFTTASATAMALFYPRMLTKDVSQAGSPDQEYTGIGIANLSNQSATLRFSAYNSNGVLVSGPGITNPATRQLKYGEQLPIIDQELFGTSVNGPDATGWVKIESDVPRVAGSFIMFDGRLSELDGADMFSTPVTSLVFPEINDNGFTKISIGNPNDAGTTLTFSLIRSDGSIRAVVTRSIPGNGALVADLYADIFPGSEVNAADYVKVSSPKAVLPYQVMGKLGEPGTEAQDLQSLQGQDAGAGSLRLYCPQYILGDVWRSTVSLVNLENAPGHVSISFIGDDGIQIGATRVVNIAPLGKFRIDDPAFFEPLMPGGGRQGYLVINSSNIRLTGSVVFGDAARRTHSTALPLVKSLSQSIVFSHVSSNDTYYTGVAITNPNWIDAHVTIQCFNRDGTMGASTTITIPSGRRISSLLTQLFPDLAGVQLYSGYLRVSSDVGMAGFSVFGTHDLRLLSAIPPQVVR